MASLETQEQVLKSLLSSVDQLASPKSIPVIINAQATAQSAQTDFEITWLSFIANDGPSDIELSFDGSNWIILKANEVLSDQPVTISKIYYRTSSDSANIRALGWR